MKPTRSKSRNWFGLLLSTFVYCPSCPNVRFWSGSNSKLGNDLMVNDEDPESPNSSHRLRRRNHRDRTIQVHRWPPRPHYSGASMATETALFRCIDGAGSNHALLSTRSEARIWFGLLLSTFAYCPSCPIARFCGGSNSKLGNDLMVNDEDPEKC
jgi:hypothetical protein